MIYTDKQYGVSRTELAKLKQALIDVEGATPDQAWLKQAQIDALRSQIAEVEAELVEYDFLRSGQLSLFPAHAGMNRARSQPLLL